MRQIGVTSIASTINEADDNKNAKSHKVAMPTVLSFFDEAIGNNSVNKRLARIMNVLLNGCASHRLNLAVRVLTAPYEAELIKIQQVMTKLKTLIDKVVMRFISSWMCLLRLVVTLC